MHLADDVPRGTLVLEIPFPPSVNSLYRSIQRGRICQAILSAKGRAYYHEAIEKIGPLKPLQGRLEVSIQLFPPDRRKRDIDNSIKAVFDVLTKAGAWIDDSQVDRLQIERKGIENRCLVTIMEI